MSANVILAGIPDFGLGAQKYLNIEFNRRIASTGFTLLTAPEDPHLDREELDMIIY